MKIRCMRWCKERADKMYNAIKGFVKTIIPKSFIYKNEMFFRSIYALLYFGKKHECNICRKNFRKFIDLSNKGLMCPNCGSLDRNRRLWHLLKHQNTISGRLLHFSPSRCLYRNLKKEHEIDYYSTNIDNDFFADYNFDITNINQPDNNFDTIICYHILEHIIDDEQAMKELYRVLKSDGTVYIQTPFKDGDIYEDFSIISKSDRLEHFGQEDHVRVYSIKGLKKRLSNVGFSVKELSFHHKDETAKKLGFRVPETIITLGK